MLDIQNLIKKVDRLWPEILKSQVTGATIFPWTVPLGPPSGRDLMEKFELVSTWLSDIRQLKEKHQLEWTLTEVKHRQMGAQSIPTHLVIPTLDCYLRWRKKSNAFQKFQANVDASIQSFPELQPWILSKPLIVDREGEIWPRILKVLTAIRAHPWPRQYLRSFHVPDVDTKFIENHRQLLDSLLTLILDQNHFQKDQSVHNLRSFCEKYGFLYDYHLIRFRFLDLTCCPTSLTDLSVPLPDFHDFQPQVETVFLTENKANGLAFPSFPKAMVIFGLGGGIDSLSSVSWLQDKTIYYWGDLDSHGFAILARLREFLPQTQSILMDHKTLELHRNAWGIDPSPKLGGFPWDRLTEDEQRTFQLLGEVLSGQHVRLEQEHIPFPYLTASIEYLIRENQARER